MNAKHRKRGKGWRQRWKNKKKKKGFTTAVCSRQKKEREIRKKITLQKKGPERSDQKRGIQNGAAHR